MSSKLKVAVITRMTTQNAGNEALSVRLIALLGDTPTVGEVRGLDRYPRYFEGLSLGSVAGRDPVGAFDALADRLVRRARSLSEGPLADLVSPGAVRLDLSARELPSRLRDLKRWLGARRRLASWGVIGRGDLETCLRTLDWADLTVWNPAGEFHPTGDPNQPFRLLLMIRIAQRLGRRTAIVNHSLEIENPLLKTIAGHVYRQAEAIVVRDRPSVAIAREMGVAPERLSEAPDLVFLTPETTAQATPPHAGAIRFAVNGLQALAGYDEWSILLDRLEVAGRPMVFVSNAMNHDLEFAARLAEGRPMTLVRRQPSHGELVDLYRGMGVLISSRLHAAILALSAGTPVVSIEPQVFKLAAIFEQMAYPLASETVHEAGWGLRVARKVEIALADPPGMAKEGHAALARQRSRIHAVYDGLFEPARDV
jgi:polysaccharide pyruvyl transferase WcaK-like protein